MGAQVVAVHVGLPRVEVMLGRTVRTAIRKRPVTGPVAVDEVGLAGDRPADPDHFGPFHAVYAFADEDLGLWSERLGTPIPRGLFGENLTTRGIDVNEALVGERWRIGTALLEVVGVRIPCSVFKGWMGIAGHDDTAWVKRFAAEGRPGPYLRVVEPGTLQVGDRIDVVHRPDHDVTVSTMFRAMTTERHLLARLAPLEGIDPEAAELARLHVPLPA